jgi:hypothetical protein
MPEDRDPPLGLELTPQQFHEAFGVGVKDGPIHPVDGVGVSLAAIQGLYELVKKQSEEIEDLRSRIAAAEAAQGK